MSSDPLLDSLRAAVAAYPEDVALRVRLARLLVQAGLHTEALVHATSALTRDPGCADASAVIAQMGGGRPAPVRPHPAADPSQPLTDAEVLARLEADFAGPTPAVPVTAVPGDVVVVQPGLRLSDIGGMAQVKGRLDASFLAPLRDPRLRERYRSTLHGGLLLYGPSGCGKATIARALAGELGAGFVGVSLGDVLGTHAGASDRSVQELFRRARRNAPCVVFLDDVDVVGGRSRLPFGDTRAAVSQLLTELDGNGVHSGPVHVLAATDQPWDVDGALRRAGRLDRMMLVTPPDLPARHAILRSRLAGLSATGLDLEAVARGTEDYTGDDLARLVATATERALLDSARSATVRPIGMPDLSVALREVRSSIGPWLDVARNVVQFGNGGGSYADLAAYLQARERR